MDEIVKEIVNLISGKDRKFTIGISGHGGSGKTTFAHKLLTHFEPNSVNYINTDPYIVTSNIRKHALISYRYKEVDYHHHKMTASHPAAHHNFALERDIHMIKDGLDFYTIGTDYVESKLISAKNKINIVEGMSVAFINLNLFDLTIYLYTDAETELMRRSIRDVADRGVNIDDLRKSQEQRRIQYELFMHPYHSKFDMVIKSSNEGYVVEKGPH